jgi:hypothetical protein
MAVEARLGHDDADLAVARLPLVGVAHPRGSVNEESRGACVR